MAKARQKVATKADAIPPDWAAYNVERRPLAALVPSPQNAKLHPPEQVTQIVNSIKEWGWTYPILVDENNNVLAGHGRRLAAEILGVVDVPVIVARGWTEDQKRAYRLADNQLGMNTGWDPDLLKVELLALRQVDFDLSLIGFPDVDLVQFMSGMGAVDPAAPQTGLGSLAEKFGVPPFSVLNAREGWWQNRKRAWLALGIQSELGRGENLIGRSPQELFCHLTGIPYDRARKIVTDALEAEGNDFDLQALVAKHGGRTPQERQRNA